MRVCGIYGVFRRGGLEDRDRQGCAFMRDGLAHRGPDSDGTVVAESLSLGMTRLKINDFVTGDQPFYSEDQRVAVIGNGEIYNAAALRVRAEKAGHKFRSRSDIEVVVHLYEELGTESFSLLRGMFAIAVVDFRSRYLHLARDPMGEKPLFYSESSGAFLFASELRSLLASRLVDPTIRKDVLDEYLVTGYVEEPRTVISDVSKLPPGSFLSLCLDSGEYSAEEFWSFENIEARQPLAVDELDQLIRSALRDTMTSDAGVALALSAGLDSSLLAALMAHESFDVAAISVGFDDEGAQQEPEDVLAGRLAQRLSIPFSRRVICTQDVAGSFAEMCWQRDEPIADITGSAYAALAETTRSVGRSVLVTGQGGDELFWGYPWVREAARAVALSRANREQDSFQSRSTRWSKFAPLLSDKSMRRNYRSFVLGQFLSARRVAAEQQSAGDGALSLLPFHPSFSAHLEDQQVLGSGEAPSLQKFNLASDTSSFLFTEAIFRSYLLNNGLAQTDRLSMAFSIENRSPLIFQPLVEAVVGSRKREDDCFLAPKTILRSVAARYLPDDVVNRQKTGFAPPVSAWITAIRDSYLEEFSDPFIVNLGLVSSVASDYLTGVVPCDWLIWTRLATLELWLRKLTEHLGRPLHAD